MVTPETEARASNPARAVVELARRLGLEVEREPTTLHDGSNPLLHLRPAPVVARVATRTAGMRQGVDGLEREMRIAGYDAHGSKPHPERLDTLVEARVYQITAWGALFVETLPRVRRRLEQQLEWLRRRPG